MRTLTQNISVNETPSGHLAAAAVALRDDPLKPADFAVSANTDDVAKRQLNLIATAGKTVAGGSLAFTYKRQTSLWDVGFTPSSPGSLEGAITVPSEVIEDLKVSAARAVNEAIALIAAAVAEE